MDSSLKLSDVILRDSKEPLDDYCRNALLEAQSRQRYFEGFRGLSLLATDSQSATV